MWKERWCWGHLRLEPIPHWTTLSCFIFHCPVPSSLLGCCCVSYLRKGSLSSSWSRQQLQARKGRLSKYITYLPSACTPMIGGILRKWQNKIRSIRNYIHQALLRITSRSVLDWSSEKAYLMSSSKRKGRSTLAQKHALVRMQAWQLLTACIFTGHLTSPG